MKLKYANENAKIIFVAHFFKKIRGEAAIKWNTNLSIVEMENIYIYQAVQDIPMYKIN